MTVQSNPTLIKTPRHWHARANAAATSPDGSTATNLICMIGASSVDGIAIGADGGRLEQVVVKHAPAASTTVNTAGVLRVFLKAKGTTFRLLGEINATVPSPTRSATAIGFSGIITGVNGLPLAILNATDEVWVGTEKAEPYDFHGDGGDY